MEWRALEEHFRVAATQEPGPFGDDAIEWDYSRYARALGLTAQPGLRDLAHRGCAVLALAPSRWDAAERKYQAWAEQRGWTLWRMSARPTVAVPDPVVYALAVRTMGSDSVLPPLVARPARSVAGKRPRSPGMSFPYTPGERWLIATDRVRRRVRAEIAMRGLVLFVEEAEHLTPAGLAVLTHLLDAHRAWRARMLCRPARVYVVFATAPEHEGSVLRMLERFHVKGNPPVGRERRRAEVPADRGSPGAPPGGFRSVEEEYLFGALAAAPFALAEEDVRGVFGASAVERCRAMAESGLLRRRVEAGLVCYAPNPVLLDQAAPPSPRALDAIRALYRRRSRRGQEHVHLAAAALAARLGEPGRAAAAVARMPYTAGAMLPLVLFEALDAFLERLLARLGAAHVAAWFSLRAHQRDHARARELASAIADLKLKTWKDLYRVVVTLLCTGRAHLTACLPHDFWPRLKSHRLAGPFMDATCVVAELFWRKRNLSDPEIAQRYEFACDCFRRTAVPPPPRTHFDRLESIIRLIAYRAAVQIDRPSNVLSPRALSTEPPPKEALRTFFRTHRIPAYIAAAPIFGELMARNRHPHLSFDDTARPLATTLTGTTGNPADLVVATAIAVTFLAHKGLRLLARDRADDYLIMMPVALSPAVRHELGRLLHHLTGSRTWSASANALLLEHGRQPDGHRDVADELGMVAALVESGDIAGARDRLVAACARGQIDSYSLSWAIVASMDLACKALDPSSLAWSAAMLDRHRAALPHDLCGYLAAMLDASRSLCDRDLAKAAEWYRRAEAALGRAVQWTRILKAYAVDNRLRAEHVAATIRRWRQRTGPQTTIWDALRGLCRQGHNRLARPSIRERTALLLAYVCTLLDEWAAHGRGPDEILRLAFFLRDPVDAVFRPLGEDFVGVMARWAPRFYERIREAVASQGGELAAGIPEIRSLKAALHTLESGWRDAYLERLDDRCTVLRLRSRGSHLRQARALARIWCDDPTTYARIGRIAEDGDMGEHVVVMFGYAGRAADAQPVRAEMAVRIASGGDGGVRVTVQSGESVVRTRARRALQAGPGGREVSFAGSSSAAAQVRAMIGAAAKCDYPVLIVGETGVGKELVARCIHMASIGSRREMIVAECAATAESLLESELFGHERGAFTGAYARHSGYFERANGSSLLLDEVDSMPARMQAALLRVIETGEYRPVGAARSRKSRFRLLSAALPRLLEMVKTGAFREDLFYRISTLRIEIPPLREREGDVEEIATAHARSLGFHLTRGALRAIRTHTWPGNVRQLRHCIQAASLRADDGRIGEAAIAEAIGSREGAPGDVGGHGSAVDAPWARALRALERSGQFTAWEFARAIHASRRTAQRHLAWLVREERIVRMGLGRATRYGVKPRRRP